MKSLDVYVCPMHPEIRQGRQGNCSMCGTHLERLAGAIDPGESTGLADGKALDQDLFESRVDVPYADPQRQKPKVCP